MNVQYLLSTLLAVLLVFNASCACASMTGEAEAGSHAHHQAVGEVAPIADCHQQPGCPDGCERAFGVAAERDAAKPSSLKFDLDDADWAAIGIALVVPTSGERTTDPPPEPLPRRASTPVCRFDLQLE